ncbi:hypothetical protein TNCV_4242871 [Trichonephila clavipes]|nr:hypothetical protein TNCV_4242871 [Trichonephila clavipes]
MDDFVDDKMDVVRDTYSAQNHCFRNKIAQFETVVQGVSLFMMNCQTKLRINHMTAVKSVAILEISIRSSTVNHHTSSGAVFLPLSKLTDYHLLLPVHNPETSSYAVKMLAAQIIDEEISSHSLLNFIKLIDQRKGKEVFPQVHMFGEDTHTRVRSNIPDKPNFV